jgi:hypothetical protein
MHGRCVKCLQYFGLWKPHGGKGGNCLRPKVVQACIKTDVKTVNTQDVKRVEWIYEYVVSSGYSLIMDLSEWS